MNPAFANPKINWKTPAKRTAVKNAVHEPLRAAIEVNTITANPAAGPLTPNGEPLAKPHTMPPTMPAMMPANKGAPDASAIPRHRGTATKNTTMLAGKSFFKLLNKLLCFIRLRLLSEDIAIILKDSNTIINNCKNIFSYLYYS